MTDLEVRHNPQALRFEAGAPPSLAQLNYALRGKTVDMLHVEVPEEYQGQGLAGKLAAAALTWAREKHLTVIPTCPFVKGYLEKHPEFH